MSQTASRRRMVIREFIQPFSRNDMHAMPSEDAALFLGNKPDERTAKFARIK
jgi:hypothetical protein